MREGPGRGRGAAVFWLFLVSTRVTPPLVPLDLPDPEAHVVEPLRARPGVSVVGARPGLKTVAALTRPKEYIAYDVNRRGIPTDVTWAFFGTRCTIRASQCSFLNASCPACGRVGRRGALVSEPTLRG